MMASITEKLRSEGHPPLNLFWCPWRSLVIGSLRRPGLNRVDGQNSWRQRDTANDLIDRLSGEPTADWRTVDVNWQRPYSTISVSGSCQSNCFLLCPEVRLSSCNHPFLAAPTASAADFSRRRLGHSTRKY